jgi:DNA repair exonuclease SbcCD ATPase subunit
MSVGNAPVTLKLDKCQKTLVTGNNGAGKSTFLSALTFGLFGKDIRGINKPSLVNSINKKNLLVEVKFETGGKEYHIKRGYKPNVFEIYSDGTLLNQTASSRDYQKYIEENILKFNFNSFKQIVVLGSKGFVPFMQLPAASRREIIEDLLDISVFTKMNTILKDKVQATKDAINDNENKINVEKQKKKVLIDHLKKIEKETATRRQEMIEKIRVLNEDTEKKQSQIEIATNKVSEIQTKQKKLLEVEKKRLEINSKINSLNLLRGRAANELEFYDKNNTCPTCRQEINHAFKCEAIGKITKTFVDIDYKAETLGLTLSKIETALELNASLGKELSTFSAAVSRLQGDVHANLKHIKLLEGEIQRQLNDDSEKSAIQEKIDSFDLSIESLELRKKELLGTREVQMYALSLLKDTGIKTKIIKTYIPMMNQMINSYLASMDFYVNFELDENFNETIKSRFRDEFQYANFSDGEKQRIDLAILFTWRQIAKIKNSMAVNLLIMDETFDASIDASGSEDLLKILDTQKDTNIAVISHRLFATDNFDRIINVEKTKNFTQYREVE